jgi:hypothetical protein
MHKITTKMKQLASQAVTSFPWRTGHKMTFSQVNFATRSDAWSPARTEVSMFQCLSNEAVLIRIAAGAQWSSFKDNTGTHSKRTCQGAMDQANTDYTFKIEWDLSNAKQK